MISSINSAKALLVYALVLPLALIMGYLLATPTEFGTWATVGMVLLVVCAPLILANHHAFLFLTWNMTAVVFFLPGRPNFWLVAAFLSLLISLGQRALSKEMRFIGVPSLVWPLMYLAAIVYLTAHLNGGVGLRVFGGENIGGRRYIAIFAAMAGFVAMCARPIPEEKALRYSGLFFLGSIPNGIGSLVPFLGPQFYFLLLFFPFEASGLAPFGFRDEIVRYWGLSLTSLGVFFYLLARYGAQEILSLKRPFRLLLLLSMLALASGGGFRSDFVFLVVTFVVVYCLEGLLWTRYSVALLALALLGCAVIVPFADRLPLSMQRTLSFLPVNISPVARFDAQGSTEWRVEIWQTVLPKVPQHFWLGKGLGISAAELELAMEMSRRGQIPTQEVAILAGDYHNGPLSVLIPFGIWGLLGLLWFWIAGLRALYMNYVYSEPSLKKLNTFLLGLFIVRIFTFVFIYGSFYDDFAIFTGILGFNAALNNGIRKPAYAPTRAAAPATSVSGVGLQPDPAFVRAT